ncbi:MAG: helix-turn-helix domain-containing protein [Bacilli bacterium]
MNQDKISKVIKNIRKSKGLTQSQFAEKYNVTYQAVSKWENGKSMPDIAILKEICQENNINLDDLLEGKNIKRKNKILLIGAISAFLLIIIIVSLILFGQNKNDFEFKTLSTSCDDFRLYGSIAYNDNKTSIYISNITYCGGNDENRYNSIECTLYEIDNNTKKKVSSYNYQDKESITLEQFLKNVNFNIDHYSKNCRIYKENGLHLEIEATDENSQTTIYKIPLIMEDNCEN